ncbi:uncharacterized protein TNCV_2182791 [Trichonephila clavipes]|uniref:Uncharacterized protein n=1 Tax=Trichonephila clavipes TaxID=2585209 RepID=A0A8X6VUZ3_TRICX|nr:uncharacterized protein TNCV_2182791 [Trichonephila clavipes]
MTVVLRLVAVPYGRGLPNVLFQQDNLMRLMICSRLEAAWNELPVSVIQAQFDSMANRWLEHRTPDRKPWVRCSMPTNTLRVHTENVLVKSVDPKVSWAESRVQGTGEYFPPLQFEDKIVGVGGVAIYRPFREFRLAKSYCHLYSVQRQVYC